MNSVSALAPPPVPLLEAEVWPDTQPGLYRSEAFAEDLDPPAPWPPRAAPAARASLRPVLWRLAAWRP
jgi:hypothetical protein